MQDTQHQAWQKAVEDARVVIEEEQGVEFTYPDLEPFRQQLQPLHDETLKAHPDLQKIYQQIQQINQKHESNEGSAV